MNSINEQVFTIISALIAILSTFVASYLAIKKNKSEKDNTLALSDRTQNVALVEQIQKQNLMLSTRVTDLENKLQEVLASNAELRVKVTFLETQKEQWQKERDIWQRERESWQMERAHFEQERREWIREKDSWEDERIDLTARIKELEQKLSRIENNVKS